MLALVYRTKGADSILGVIRGALKTLSTTYYIKTYTRFHSAGEIHAMLTTGHHDYNKEKTTS